MTPAIATEIQLQQEHGRQKYGGSVVNYDHDDALTESEWLYLIDSKTIDASYATPQEFRHKMIQIAGLAISAVEAFDRKQTKG